MEQDRSENDDSRSDDFLAVRRNDSSDDAGKTDYRAAGQCLFNFRKTAFIAECRVKGEAERYGQDSYDQYRFEHSERVHVDVFAREAQHENGRHNRGEKCRYGRHPNGKRDIALAEKTHNIG